MTALLVYLAVALGFSFLCSIMEAVLLSVSSAYANFLKEQGKKAGGILQGMKKDIDAPLAAILSLNTIAHTAGAAGVGAQAAALFGDQYLGIASAILTLLILIISEIIPKTLGSVYWRELAVPVAHSLKYLIWGMMPFVWMSRFITRRMKVDHTLTGFSREELVAMANLGEIEGQLHPSENRILNNVLRLREMTVADIMTPRAVVFSLPSSTSVDVFFHGYEAQRFSRIPVFTDHEENISGFVLRSDLLKAKARGNGDKLLSNYVREVSAVIDKLSVLAAFERFIQQGSHIMIVLDEYSHLKGLVTLEDVLETLMGLEIVDEHDFVDDLQKLAKRRWKKRAGEMGIDIDHG